MNKLTGTLLYVCLNKPVAAYVKAGEPVKPKEWKASVAIADEDTVDAFEAYAASIDAKVSVKKVKASEFTEKYKAPVPEGAGKNVWVITFRKSTELGKTGNPVPELYRPKVFERTGKVLVDVTNSKLPGNGSIGTISTEVYTRTNGTSSIYLKNVMVTEMVEYEGGSSYEPGEEFDEDGDDAPEPKAEAPKEVVKAPKKPKAATVAADEDAPF